MRAPSWIVASGLLLASSAHAEPGLGAAAGDAARVEHVEEAAAGPGWLGDRVAALEKEVARLAMPVARHAPSDAELKRARLEEERQAEFLKEVWTRP